MGIILLLLFTIALYFLINWLFNRYQIGKEKDRKFWSVFSSIIIAPTIFFALGLILIVWINYYPKIDFDPDRWETHVETRYKMSKHMIKSEMLIGKSKEEVIELLGSDYYKHGNMNISYNLGFVPSGISIDPDILMIEFENDIVVKVKQRRT